MKTIAAFLFVFAAAASASPLITEEWGEKTKTCTYLDGTIITIASHGMCPRRSK